VSARDRRARAVRLALVVVAAFAATSAVHALGLHGWSASAVVAGLLGAFVFGAATVSSRAADRRARAFAARLRARDARALSTLDDPALDPIHHELLDIGHELRRRERELAQGEALLLGIVEMTPAALLLIGSNGEVLATNEASRSLFFAGEDVVGRGMIDLLRQAQPLLKRVLAATGDELLVVEDADGSACTRHLVKRYFELGGDDVVLVMVSDLSREIARQEVDVYRRVIRVLSHEVNNSLAPISSLMHSARLLADAAPRLGDGASRTDERLRKVFDTVAERAEHLRRFLDGYSELARLPLPRKELVVWPSFFERLGALYPGIRLGIRIGRPDSGGAAPDERGWFDRAQLEQVIVNLVKNAEEAGSARADIDVSAEASAEHGTRIVVRDRGRGMSPEVMKNALVPLFSTKENGSGLGLALCREIVEAHGGTLRLMARTGGGLEVVIRLPPRSRTKVRSFSGPLTATRG
jgi:nitrogen fixation/metabolism regulation signal transduction histidine kinase